DLVINIVDSASLDRSLILTQQLIETGIPVVLALNMLDVANAQGIAIDAPALSRRLGLPVFPMVASRRQGISEMLKSLVEIDAVDGEAITRESFLQGSSERQLQRHITATEISREVMQISPVQYSPSERLDMLMLNRWLGIPIFLGAIYLMFTIAINLGSVFIDFFDILFGALLVDQTTELMTSAALPGWLIVIVANGLGGGIQLVATFIPVIGFLFLCLSIMEDSGYLARAAFVVDRMMISIGLPGSAFVPLIVGFGCNVPSVMASRSLARENDRLMTIAMAPFMSCGARLTVYALFAAAFFENNGQNLVFLLYLLGIAMAVFTGWVFRKQIFDGRISPSFHEMPAYHLPIFKNIMLTTWFRLKSFIFRAGKTIVVVVVCLSFLNSLGTDQSFGNENTEKSLLSVIGKSITPIFKPMGLTVDNWPATVGLFTGIFAKEAVVGTLDALYSGAERTQPMNLSDSIAAAFQSIIDNASGLTAALSDPLGLKISEAATSELVAVEQGVTSTTLTQMAAKFGSEFAAFCYLVFILLYAPCVAVLGSITKEAGWRWMLLVFSWTTGLGYISATCLYQIGTFTEHSWFSATWLISCCLLLLAAIGGLRQIGRRALPAQLIPVVQA
ncbi:MAG: ferrous iron transport protein B, partial [Pseudomonadales bacterium]|nr:ferrous iron transport protein B [Pseudomonadales bacterium]